MSTAKTQLNPKVCIVEGCGLVPVKLQYCFEHYRVFQTGVLPERLAHKVGGPCNFCKVDVPADKCFKANGLTFHPEHFTCTVCQKNLVGAQTGFDAGVFYCEEDYLKKFSSACARCHNQITSGFVEALGKKWCDFCFSCEGCKKPLEEVFNKDGRPYCLTCYEKEDLAALTCAKCEKSVDTYGEMIQNLGQTFHIECFRCFVGDHKILSRDRFFKNKTNLYCEKHWEESKLSDPDKCQGCKRLILTEYVAAGAKEFHIECFECLTCKSKLEIGTAREFNDLYFCGKCFGKVPKDGSKGVYVNGVYIPGAASLIEGKHLVKGYGDKEARPGSVPPSESKSYPLATLQLPYEKCPPKIDYRQKEMYLSDKEFQTVFSMSKAEWLKQPFWRITELKKQHNLW
eukprot:gb/GEZN01004903.1/.p1 GENE.gb/GEZN01004903.1/~~gb/GEZN01004903.1/.p1  ORF type:complete len:399 (-),score=51.74 gb/GEZN01004903.1/:662-1858(-)